MDAMVLACFLLQFEPVIATTRLGFNALNGHDSGLLSILKTSNSIPIGHRTLIKKAADANQIVDWSVAHV